MTTETELTIIDHSSDILTPRTIQYVERFNGFARKTAENFIELAKTIVEAEEELSADEQAEFFREIRITRGGSSHKKLRAIGGAFSRFSPYMEKLPGAWTTLYQLAKLESQEFERVADSGRLSPVMTASDITDVLQKSRAPRSKETATLPTASFDLSGVNAGAVASFCVALKSLAKGLGIRVRLDDALKTASEAGGVEVPFGTTAPVEEV